MHTVKHTQTQKKLTSLVRERESRGDEALQCEVVIGQKLCSQDDVVGRFCSLHF